ncbi:MAG: helix-turn-helix domain-containing protein [Dysgonamonadaceae bacterium]|nr:helix-turn-helix domain-containing protein [Dysgonamonadaceae bacterium]
MARQFYFKTWQVADGLSHSSANCILQDSYGFIWIGTSDGLNRFDGRKFKVYKNNLKDKFSLGNNFVHALCEDANRNLWIGTVQGIFLFDYAKELFLHFGKKTGFDVSVSCEISKIIQSKNGNIWIATLGQGFFIYDPVKDILTQNSYYTPFVWDICENDTGRIYVSSMQEGLLCFDSDGKLIERYATFLNTGGDGNSRINCVRKIKDRIWFGAGNNRLCCLDIKTGEIKSFNKEGFNIGAVRCIADYSEQELLIGTDKGLYLFNVTNSQFIRPNTLGVSFMPGESPVYDILKDREGGYWILTDMGGVNYLAQQSKNFEYYHPVFISDRIEGKVINAFCEDKNHRVWIGSQDGLRFLDPETQTLQSISNMKNDVRCLLADGDRLWIGTFGDGLKIMDLNTKIIRQYHYNREVANSICGNDVLSIYKSSSGKIYVGASWGLSSYNPETDNFTTVNQIGSMISVTGMIEDSRGNLWIATYNSGVLRCEQESGRWSHFSHNTEDINSINSNSVICLFEDCNGEVWFGTNGNGLCRYNPENNDFIDFDPQNAVLPDKIIYAMEQDNAGYFWIATNAGLLRINPKNKLEWKLFTQEHGLQNNQFNARASLKSSAGRFYFGGINGFNAFCPSEFKQNSYIPPVYIVDLKFYDRRNKNIQKTTFMEKTAVYRMRKLTLPFNRNSFRVEFAALSYEDPLRNQFAYCMEGFDSEWIYSEQNSATYTALSPGEYVFYVKASNNDGIWNETGAVIHIVISPPWWLSVWACIFYCISMIAVAYGIYRFISRRTNAKIKRKIEEYNALKEKEVYRSKIDFFVNLVHEFRTPLSLIRLPVDKLTEILQNDKYLSKYLSIVSKNIDYLLGVVNQLVDFQKVESSKAELRYTPQSLYSLMQDIYSQFAGYLEMRSITFDLELPKEDKTVLIDRDSVTKIIVNLLSNAIKYTHSRITLSMEYSEMDFTISVADDGSGVEDIEKEKIFDAFYQSKETMQTGGTGVGLAFAKSLAKNHRAKLYVKDNKWGGATFSLCIPVEIENINFLQSYPNKQELPDTGNKLPENGEAFFHSCQILLVEDNEELLEMTSEMLGEYFTVLKAPDGQKALECLDCEAVDLIVSDIMMPGIDGFELCRRVKTDLNLSHIPVILLTAKTTMEAKIEGMEHGADAYIEKPFSIKYLKNQIENLLKLRMAFRKIALTMPVNVETMHSISKHDREFICKLHAEIDRHISEESFSVGDLAGILCMSHSSFYRKIKAILGMSPNDYLRVYRLNKAVALLKDSNLQITDIAMRLGFEDASYFSRRFKQYFGTSPTEYRNNSKK